jgi:hypothetical protein
MRTLLVGYDLNQPGQNYAALIEKLKSFGTYWHHLDSTWLVKTALTPVQIRNELARFIDPNDELLVLDVTAANWAARGFKQRAYDWLHTYL